MRARAGGRFDVIYRSFDYRSRGKKDRRGARDIARFDIEAGTWERGRAGEEGLEGPNPPRRGSRSTTKKRRENGAFSSPRDAKRMCTISREGEFKRDRRRFSANSPAKAKEIAPATTYRVCRLYDDDDDDEDCILARACRSVGRSQGCAQH